jgi:hypothetical protein
MGTGSWVAAGYEAWLLILIPGNAGGTQQAGAPIPPTSSRLNPPSYQPDAPEEFRFALWPFTHSPSFDERHLLGFMGYA